MEPQTIITLYAVLLAAVTAAEQLLLQLNLQRAKKQGGTVPPEFQDSIPSEVLRRSTRYTISRGRLARISELTSRSLLLVLALTGLPGPMLSFWTAHLPGSIRPGLALIVSLSLLIGLVELPFSLYGQFRIEDRFGFNRMTLGLFLADLLREALLSLLIGLPLLALLFLFVETTGDLWWVIGFGITAGLQILLTLVYPLWIAPLFNRFSPLQEGSLRDRLLALAQRAHFPVQGIYIMDGSRRSRHSNAYFTGFGRSRRIVLYDTLTEQLTEDQLEGVLAHEIGHWKKKHILTGFLLSLAAMAAVFFLLHRFLEWDALFLAFGLDGSSPAAAFALGLYFFSPFLVLLTPAASLFTRRHEYQADQYSADLTGHPEYLKNGLIRLSKNNLSNLNPHPAYSFVYYSHPTVSERIRALEGAAPGKRKTKRDKEN